MSSDFMNRLKRKRMRKRKREQEQIENGEPHPQEQQQPDAAAAAAAPPVEQIVEDDQDEPCSALEMSVPFSQLMPPTLEDRQEWANGDEEGSRENASVDDVDGHHDDAIEQRQEQEQQQTSLVEDQQQEQQRDDSDNAATAMESPVAARKEVQEQGHDSEAPAIQHEIPQVASPLGSDDETVMEEKQQAVEEPPEPEPVMSTSSIRQSQASNPRREDEEPTKQQEGDYDARLMAPTAPSDDDEDDNDLNVEQLLQHQLQQQQLQVRKILQQQHDLHLRHELHKARLAHQQELDEQLDKAQQQHQRVLKARVQVLETQHKEQLDNLKQEYTSRQEQRNQEVKKQHEQQLQRATQELRQRLKESEQSKKQLQDKLSRQQYELSRQEAHWKEQQEQEWRTQQEQRVEEATRQLRLQLFEAEQSKHKLQADLRRQLGETQVALQESRRYALEQKNKYYSIKDKFLRWQDMVKIAVLQGGADISASLTQSTIGDSIDDDDEQRPRSSSSHASNDNYRKQRSSIGQYPTTAANPITPWTEHAKGSDAEANPIVNRAEVDNGFDPSMLCRPISKTATPAGAAFQTASQDCVIPPPSLPRQPPPTDPRVGSSNENDNGEGKPRAKQSDSKESDEVARLLNRDGTDPLDREHAKSKPLNRQSLKSNLASLSSAMSALEAPQLERQTTDGNSSATSEKSYDPSQALLDSQPVFPTPARKKPTPVREKENFVPKPAPVPHPNRPKPQSKQGWMSCTKARDFVRDPSARPPPVAAKAPPKKVKNPYPTNSSKAPPRTQQQAVPDPIASSSTAVRNPFASSDAPAVDRPNKSDWYKKNTKGKKNQHRRPQQGQAPHQEVVRSRAERQKMPGHSCDECNKYIAAVRKSDVNGDLDNVLPKHFETCSRHRSYEPPSSTPEGFWDLSFADEKPKPQFEQEDDFEI